jgi:MoaA/NifB/PqqE/SkfB family radical SAM enzyme
MKRWIGLASAMLKSNFARLAHPMKLTFILTYRCNTHCEMCNIWKRSSKGQMTADEVETFFSKNRGFRWINLSGGEIWLRDDLLDLIRSMFRHSPGLFLLDFPTTGQTPERIEGGVREILTLAPRRLLITVSLDGPPEVHDRIRNKSGAFDRCVETFERLRAIRPAGPMRAYFGTTLSRYNQGRLADTLAAVRERLPWVEPTDFHVNVAQESGHYYQNEGQGVREGIGDVLHGEMESFLGKKPLPLSPVAYLESRYQRLLNRFRETGRSPLPCLALSSSVFIDPFWSVYPCSMFDEKIGNLRENGFDLGAVWRSRKAREVLRVVTEERCPHCWTPCEAYQTILGNMLPWRRIRGVIRKRGESEASDGGDS